MTAPREGFWSNPLVLSLPSCATAREWQILLNLSQPPAAGEPCLMWGSGLGLGGALSGYRWRRC